MKNLIKNILDRFINYFQKQTTITVMCWDLETDGEINFTVEYQHFPPIGALVNHEPYKQYFKIEAFEIQSHGGFFCIAYGRFTEEIRYGNIEFNAEKTVKGSELIFISQIDRDGRATEMVLDSDLKHLVKERFTLNRLSMSRETYIASGFNSYVVKLKK